MSGTAWKAMVGNTENMQGGVTTCFPADGQEVIAAVTGPECGLIILTRSYFDPYQIDKEMVVSGRKVILGNPLTLPALNSSKIERLFHGKCERGREGKGWGRLYQKSVIVVNP